MLHSRHMRCNVCKLHCVVLRSLPGQCQPLLGRKHFYQRLCLFVLQQHHFKQQLRRQLVKEAVLAKIQILKATQAGMAC